MYIQVMPEADAEKVPYHPFDLTKVWPKKDYPLIEVGVMELNRNPENFFADVEQSAFAPNNLVPGISVSPDKMLQARLFAYSDAQRYRLGVNHHQIPVNAARCPVHSNHRDGAMRVDGNYGGTLHYEPNSYQQWQEQPEYREPPLKINGNADFWNFREDDDDYFKQPGDLFRLMTPEQQQVLFDNTARAMGDAPEFIKLRHIGNCSKADPAYGAGVAKALGLESCRCRCRADGSWLTTTSHRGDTEGPTSDRRAFRRSAGRRTRIMPTRSRTITATERRGASIDSPTQRTDTQ